jgi:siroheme synthase-like protein
MAFNYPVLLDVSRLPVLVVGGGEVAVRKVRGLLAAGASDVRVVAPVFHAEMPPAVRRVVARYEAGQIQGARLVFAATDDPDVNRRIVEDAAAAGALVSRADHDPDGRGDFSLPALHRDGSLLISVSTGHSPALAAAVRDAVARELDPAYAKLATYSDELRVRLHGMASVPPEERRRLLRLLASPAALDLTREADIEVLWHWLLRQHRGPDTGVE